jgi:hypothetical protein
MPLVRLYDRALSSLHRAVLPAKARPQASGGLGSGDPDIDPRTGAHVDVTGEKQRYRTDPVSGHPLESVEHTVTPRGAGLPTLPQQHAAVPAAGVHPLLRGVLPPVAARAGLRTSAIPGAPAPVNKGTNPGGRGIEGGIEGGAEGEDVSESHTWRSGLKPEAVKAIEEADEDSVHKIDIISSGTWSAQEADRAKKGTRSYVDEDQTQLFQHDRSTPVGAPLRSADLHTRPSDVDDVEAAPIPTGYSPEAGRKASLSDTAFDSRQQQSRADSRDVLGRKGDPQRPGAGAPEAPFRETIAGALGGGVIGRGGGHQHSGSSASQPVTGEQKRYLHRSVVSFLAGTGSSSSTDSDPNAPAAAQGGDPVGAVDADDFSRREEQRMAEAADRIARGQALPLDLELHRPSNYEESGITDPFLLFEKTPQQLERMQAAQTHLRNRVEAVNAAATTLTEKARLSAEALAAAATVVEAAVRREQHLRGHDEVPLSVDLHFHSGYYEESGITDPLALEEELARVAPPPKQAVGSERKDAAAAAAAEEAWKPAPSDTAAEKREGGSRVSGPVTGPGAAQGLEDYPSSTNRSAFSTAASSAAAPSPSAPSERPVSRQPHEFTSDRFTLVDEERFTAAADVQPVSGGRFRRVDKDLESAAVDNPYLEDVLGGDSQGRRDDVTAPFSKKDVAPDAPIAGAAQSQRGSESTPSS